MSDYTKVPNWLFESPISLGAHWFYLHLLFYQQKNNTDEWTGDIEAIRKLAHKTFAQASHVESWLTILQQKKHITYTKEKTATGRNLWHIRLVQPEDFIRVESDPNLPQSIQKAVDGWGNMYGLVMKNRMEGQFCQRRRVNLKVVIFASIMDYLERLYAETMFSPEYLFLNEADYEHLQYNDPDIAQMRRYSTVETPNTNKRGYVVKIGSVGGKYVTLATLPDLQEGEVMVLYDYQ